MNCIFRLPITQVSHVTLTPTREKLLSYVRIIGFTSLKLIRFIKAKYCHLSIRRNPLGFCFRAAAGFYLHFGV